MIGQLRARLIEPSSWAAISALLLASLPAPYSYALGVPAGVVAILLREKGPSP